jgi:beta-glucosidase
LSYSKFECSQLRPGAEVAQVYVSQKHAPVSRPPKELKAFARLDLQPDQTRLAVLSLDARSFAHFDAAAKQRRCDPGEFEILISASAEDIRLRGAVSLSKPSILH